MKYNSEFSFYIYKRETGFYVSSEHDFKCVKCTSDCEGSKREIQALMENKIKQINLNNLVDPKKVGIRKAHQKASFDNFKATNLFQQLALSESIDIAKNIVSGRFDNGILLYGSSGNGKTHLSVSILRYICENLTNREVSSNFMKFTSLQEHLEHLIAADKSQVAMIESNLQNVPVLVLDDLGKEYSKGVQDGLTWGSAKFFKFLDYRCGAGLTTIMTSNLTEKEIIARYSKASWSRLKDLSKPILVKGDDRRGIIKRMLKIMPTVAPKSKESGK